MSADSLSSDFISVGSISCICAALHFEVGVEQVSSVSATLCQNASVGVLLALWTLLGRLEGALEPNEDGYLLRSTHSECWPLSTLHYLVVSASDCLIANMPKPAIEACRR